MKKADLNKEHDFVEYFSITGNAAESARLSGYVKNASQMGYYLKNKLHKKIEDKQRDNIQKIVPKSMEVLKSMLDSKSDSVKLSTCKYILSDLNGYGKQDINIHRDEKCEEDNKKIEAICEENFSHITDEEYKKIVEAESNKEDGEDKDFRVLIETIRTGVFNRKYSEEIKKAKNDSIL
ncbi:terminase small subunit [Gammaproteobacteria bacterium]|nr:terminase small subunit [Gammaproteobacteria bacterium]